ncbi:MAG TPA: hypothetical protein VGO93_07300 [Candidatus Xenobia bacterium]
MNRAAGSSGRRRGFVLVAALALLFAMVAFTLMLATQGRTMTGFTLQTEGTIFQHETALAATAQVRSVLQGEESPPTLGLPATLAASGTFTGNNPTDTAVTGFTGTLTYQSPAPSGGPEGYQSAVTVGGVAVPTDHSLATFTDSITATSTTEMAAHQYLAVFSSLNPYGLLAPNGGVTVQSARSVSNLDGNDPHIQGLMVHIFASGSISVTGQLNGRAYSTGNSITVAQGGIIYPGWANSVAMPNDFTTSFNTYKSQVVTGLNDISGKFNDLHSALHEDFSGDEGADYAAAELQAAADGGTMDGPFFEDPLDGGGTQATVNSPGSTDTNGSELDVGTSLRIPSGDKDELNFNPVKISNDLLLEDNTVLHVKGDLQVTGAIRMGKMSSLIVDGSTTAGSVEPNYSPPSSQVSIQSAIYGQQTITISNGMQQEGEQWTPDLPTTTSNPFPETLEFSVLVADDPAYDIVDEIDNIAYTDFETRQGVDMGRLTGIDMIMNYLVDIITIPPATTDAVPGVMMVSDNAVTAGNCTKMAGFFIGSGVSLPNTTHVVGAVYAPSGSIDLGGSDFRFFPYWTRAFGETAGGPLVIDAWNQHPITYGETP